MSGEDHSRTTSRKHPVNIVPDGEKDRHISGGHCPCPPTLETWRMGGRVTHRLMHRELEQGPA